MFKYITDMEHNFNFKGQDAYLAQFNLDTNLFVVENEDGDKIGEVNLFESGIHFNIDYFENWQEKLFNSLLKNNGIISVFVNSTELNAGDSWELEIYRYKTLLPTSEYSDQIILTSYVILFCGEVKGDAYTRQHRFYSGCMIDERKEFETWIEAQLEKVSEFNNDEYWNTSPSFVYAEGICDKDEEEILFEMFSKKIDCIMK